MNQFREVLKTQWKWSSGAVLLCAIGAFTAPILSLQNAVIRGAGEVPGYSVGVEQLFLQAMERWSVLYTLLAAGLGLALAMLAWASDHRGRHVYALSLPVERWRYVLMRYNSGGVLLLVPVIALLAGGLIAAATTDIPAGLTAYPAALAFRFGLAALVAYSIFFAISAGTPRAAGFVLAPIALLVVADVLLAAVGIHASLLERAVSGVLGWPGVLEIFSGRWLLIDV